MKRGMSQIPWEVNVNQRRIAILGAGNIGTAIADAYACGKVLYPDKFSDVNLPKKADEVYTFFLGKPVYQRMKKDFGELGGVVSFQ